MNMVKSHVLSANLMYVSRSPVGWTRTNNLCVRSANLLLLLKPRTGFIFHRALSLELPPVTTTLPFCTAPQFNRPVGTRTRDLLFVGQPFSPLNYRPMYFRVGTGGLEPPISCVSDRRLNQLGYVPIFDR